MLLSLRPVPFEARSVTFNEFAVSIESVILQLSLVPTSISKVDGAIPVPQVVLPFALVDATIEVNHATTSIFHVLLVVPFVQASFVNQSSSAVLFSFHVPVSLVDLISNIL